MATIPFAVESYLGNTRGEAIGWYHPYRVRGEKNPAFDKFSGSILALKDPSRNDHERAVQLFAIHLIAYLKNNPWIPVAEIITLPSHVAGKQSVGLDKVVSAICKKDQRFVSKPGVLYRTKTIEKLAKGGPRSVQVHRDSMGFRQRPGAPITKIVLDDVVTTANSMVAAVELIRSSGAPGKPMPTVALCLALGRTALD